MCFPLQDNRALSFLNTSVFDIYNLGHTDDVSDALHRYFQGDVTTYAKLRTEQMMDITVEMCIDGSRLVSMQMKSCISTLQDDYLVDAQSLYVDSRYKLCT